MANDMAVNEAKHWQKNHNSIQNTSCLKAASSISLLLALVMIGFPPYRGFFIIVLKLLLLLTVQTEEENVNGNQLGYYMLSAASTIFSGRTYGVVVALFESKGSSSCEVFLRGPSINTSIEMHLTPLKPISSYRFQLPELLPGDYWLTVRSLRGMDFYNTTKLTWRNFKNFIKIQTPKTTYHNGELLQFRVFFHNGTMNFVQPDSEATVWIEDSRGYHVKLFKQLVVHNGVFQSSLRISKNPNLGQWRICAKNGEYVSDECVHIQVKEDEIKHEKKLPLRHNENKTTGNSSLSFKNTLQDNLSTEAAVNITQNITIENSNLSLNKTLGENKSTGAAKETMENSNMPINKTLQENRSTEDTDNITQKITRENSAKPINKTLQENGSTKVEKNITQQIIIKNSTITLNKTLQENKSTGATENISQKITRENSAKPINKTLQENGSTKVKNNIAQQIIIKNTTITLNNTLQDNRSTKATDNITQKKPMENSNMTINKTLQENKSTKVEKNITQQIIIKNTTLTLNNTLQDNRSTDATKNITLQKSNGSDNIVVNNTIDNLSNTTIQTRGRPVKRKENLIVIDYGFPVGKPELVKLKLEYKFNYAICVIVFNGIILSSGQIFPDKTDTYLIEVQLTNKLWPFVELFIYGMKPDSQVLYVATHIIEVQRWKHEHAEIDVPTEVSPGEEITMRIKAIPKSYLGLLIVDSESFHKNINDINDNYFNVVKSQLRAIPQKKVNEASVNNLSLITMTNAKSAPEITTTFRTKVIILPNRESAPKGRSNPFENLHLRDIFKKTLTKNNSCCDPQSKEIETKGVWLFDNIENTLPGWRNWTTRVPDKIAHWELNAFLVDPIAGLTLLRPMPFISINSTKPLYLEYTVPQHIKVGETLELPVDCFNQLKNELNVIIRVLQNETHFKLLDNEKNSRPESNYMEKELNVPSNNFSSVNITLIALKSGTLELNIMAISGAFKDTKIRQIEVILAGQLLSHQMVAFESLGSHLKKTNFEFKLPHKPTTEGVKCYLSGNLIAANIQSLKSNEITRMDNGEQLITKLLSIYYLWDYVKVQSAISDQYRHFLEDQLNDGFQSLMRLRGRDGSYTYSEPPRSNCSSTWLTAYALYTMHFLQMTPIGLDDHQLSQTENVLLNRRLNRTQFIDKCLTPQRRHIDQLELSMEVLKVLQMSTRIIRVQESHSWIIKQLQNNNDYHLEAKRAHILPDWIRPENRTNGNWTKHRRNIETAARILSGQIMRKKTPQFEIYKWLVPRIYGDDCKENSYECFIAIQAIYNYIRSPMKAHPPSLSILMGGNIPDQHKININAMNQWQTQQVQLQASDNQTLNFQAEGQGELLVRCSYEYEPIKQQRKNQKKSRYYELQVTEEKSSHISDFYLKVCVKRHNMDQLFYIGTELALHLPSGYVLSSKSVHRLVQLKIVLQASSEDNNTKLFLRLGAIKLNVFTCVSVLTNRIYNVKKLQPGMMTVYDTNSMYEPEVHVYNVTF